MGALSGFLAKARAPGVGFSLVKTPQGPIELCPPEPAQLRALRELLPLGAVQYSEPQHGARFGLVMKCGDREAFAVKQQPVEVPTDVARTCYTANSLLIALSLRTYLEHDFSGFMMPCAYLREKGASGVEAGIAYFGAPDPKGKEALDFPHDDSFGDDAFDKPFGTGFTIMLTQAVRAIQAYLQFAGDFTGDRAHQREPYLSKFRTSRRGVPGGSY